jgi:hypothetical protein
MQVRGPGIRVYDARTRAARYATTEDGPRCWHGDLTLEANVKGIEALGITGGGSTCDCLHTPRYQLRVLGWLRCLVFYTEGRVPNSTEQGVCVVTPKTFVGRDSPSEWGGFGSVQSVLCIRFHRCAGAQPRVPASPMSQKLVYLERVGCWVQGSGFRAEDGGLKVRG